MDGKQHIMNLTEGKNKTVTYTVDQKLLFPNLWYSCTSGLFCQKLEDLRKNITSIKHLIFLKISAWNIFALINIYQVKWFGHFLNTWAEAQVGIQVCDHYCCSTLYKMSDGADTALNQQI
jgi:hypothetical protein